MTQAHDEEQATNPDPLLTVAQAADYLGISERFVRRALAADEGGIVGVRLGRLVRIRQSALEAYIQGQSR